jgi:hypothetical protein
MTSIDTGGASPYKATIRPSGAGTSGPARVNARYDPESAFCAGHSLPTR